MSSIINNKTFPVIFVGLLFALILVSACTDTSQPPVSPAPTQILESPVTLGTSGNSGALVTTEIPATTNTPGNPACSSGQTLCDGSCVDTQSNIQHCGACGNVCNESEPCSEGTCLSWTGSWINDFGDNTYILIQTGTSVNGTNYYNQIIVSGTISGNPPRFTGTYTVRKNGRSFPFTYDMAPNGKSFTGGLLGYNTITYTREQD